MESLESRQLLSITLPTISNVALSAGTTAYVPLAGASAGQTVNYAVTVSDYSKVAPVMMPSDNQTVEMKVKINGVDQPMDFQLLDNLAPNTSAQIESLVSQGFYDGLQIYRNQSGFVIQGGNNPPTGAIKDPTSFTDSGLIAEEFKGQPDLYEAAYDSFSEMWRTVRLNE